MWRANISHYNLKQMNILKLLLVLLPLATALGQPYWEHMLHPERMANPLGAEVVHYSSWARNNGNSDLGWYYGYDPNGWQILCDIEGPGVITDMWWTRDGVTPAWRWRLYVDNMAVALIDTPLTYPFGDMQPFAPPIADSSSGGYYSYLPIPFQSRVRIVYNHSASIYYHVTALKYPPGTPMTSFTMPPSAEYNVMLDSLRQRMLTPQTPIYSPFETRADCTATLAVGQTMAVIDEPLTGRTRRVLLRLQNRTQQVFEKLWIRVYTDGYPLPDIEGPISVALGTPLGWRPYQSVVTGSIGDTLYFNLPIVADNGIRIELENRTAQAQPFTVAVETISGASGEYRLNGQHSDGNPTRLWENFKIAEFQGEGNFVGTVQDMQQSDPHVLEGDEAFYFNGETVPSWHGTGTEDYFKGGRYWTPVYDQEEFHGCVAYLGDSAAAYRWHNNDPLPFSNGLKYDTEIGRFNNFTGHYRTMAYAYVKRRPWQVMDESGDKTTYEGEQLRIIGQRLNPEISVYAVSIGDSMLVPTDNVTLSINADSILDVTFVMQDSILAGVYPLLIWTDDGVDTIETAWKHLGRPTLWFRPVRTDIDNAVYAGDTLDIEVQGLRPDETAWIGIDGQPSSWLGAPPVADATGKLTGRVRVRHGLPEGDYEVTAAPEVSSPTSSDSLLHCRDWFRVEPEVLYHAGWSGARLKEEWCRDWLRANNFDPWGRYAVHQLTGANINSYVTFRFYAPEAGIFRTAYFFGKTSNAPIVRVEINGQASLPNTDMYEATLYQSWERSDTLWGGTHTLNQGMNTVTMRTTGLNPASAGWKANFDQMVFFAADTVEAPPLPVEELTIHLEDSLIHLTWLPVVEDVLGNSLTPVAYDILRALPGDSVWHWQAEVPGADTTWAHPLFGGDVYEFAVCARRDATVPLAMMRKAEMGKARSSQ